MTTYPLTMPTDPKPNQCVIKLDRASSSSESGFTFESQEFLWPGARWIYQIALPSMTREQAAKWASFLAKLKGSFGTFMMGDPAWDTPLGVATGTPLVKGAGQTGLTLLVDGCTPSITDWAKEGDYFQLGTGADSRLHMITEDANTDGSGEVTLTFEPALREAPTDNTPLTFIGAKGVFKMSAKDCASWDVSIGMEHGFSFTAVEKV
jgi:hypothetical protein